MTAPDLSLSDDEETMLAIERLWWRYAGLKEQEIRAKLDIGMTTYYQRLNVLIDTERAMARDPHTVKRLQRIRAQRQRSRSTRHSV